MAAPVGLAALSVTLVAAAVITITHRGAPTPHSTPPVAIVTGSFAASGAPTVAVTTAPSGSPSATSAPVVTNGAPHPTATAPIVAPAPTTAPGGWPQSGNTGVPAGTSLTAASGAITLSQPGRVYDAVDLNTGCISVTANNVTINRVRVSGGAASCGGYLIYVAPGVTGTVISDTEVAGNNVALDNGAVGGDRLTCLRCNIHNVAIGLRSPAGLIQDSYVHDLIGSSSGSAYAVLFEEGNGMTIRHNTLDNPRSSGAAIALSPDFGPTVNITIDNNRLGGGGYAIYGGAGSEHYQAQTRGIVVSNNRFTRTHFANSGYWGVDAEFNPSRPGDTWNGNVWDDTGAAIPTA